jgi:hypothetical protein
VRELFGPVLDDPASRLRLLLALGWEPGPEAPVPELTEPVPDPGAAGTRRRSR